MYTESQPKNKICVVAVLKPNAALGAQLFAYF